MGLHCIILLSMAQVLFYHQISLTEGYLGKQLFDMHSWHTEAETKWQTVCLVSFVGILEKMITS